MRDTTIEDYLGAIYQLQKSSPTQFSSHSEPVPLSQIRDRFGFTHISIHEMIQKLELEDLVAYTPYQGVILTQKGELRACALLSRHQTWERFLVEQLGIPAEEAHTISHQLEHAAPQLVTERLDHFLKKYVNAQPMAEIARL